MITWETIWKLVVSTSIVGTVLTALWALIALIFKSWIINFFKRDLIRFEKNIKEELKDTELKLSKLISLEENYYKSLLEAYRRIWKKLSALSRHLSSDFVRDLDEGKYVNTNQLLDPIKNYVFDITDDTIFLSKNLDMKISILLNSFLINDINEVLGYLMELSKIPSKGQSEMDELNRKINKMQLNFVSKRDEIKELIQKDYFEIMKNNQ